jgi:hypothetical protein
MRPLPTSGGPARRLREFSLVEKMAFVSSWFPPNQHEHPMRQWASCRWTSWDSYIRDYLAVRDEARDHFPQLGRPLFAERVLAYRERHGAEALSRASYTDIRGTQ